MKTIQTSIERFLQQESAAGILLMFSAVLAMIVANTPLSVYYDLLLDTPVEITIGNLEVAKPLLLWINDGLMALFFLLVGLELKREMLIGELSSPGKIMLPAIGAIGGMLVPALIYIWFNYDDPVNIQGWAIPAATDIAFALGILTLLGSRVPIALKIFLTSLAIFDDVGAVLIIAFFYTANLSTTALIFVAACVPLLAYLNYRGVTSRSAYVFIGVIMWTAMLKSGVHATLAGILLAFFIPLKSEEGPSPLKSLEHDLHSLVAFFVLPVFAFANAGINLHGIGLDQLMHPVPVGIALGLFVGKQLGIFGLCWLALKTKLVRMPEGMNYASLYGTACLAGVGFTMSLFIGSLAFEENPGMSLFDERLGIITGSIASGLVGYFVLAVALKKPPTATEK
jgi:NhaA family Na+:H+ antiporter